MLRSKLKFAKGLAIGATAAYLFDPDHGRARRTRVREHLIAEGKRGARSAGKRLRYEAGQVKNRALHSVGRGSFEPVDDRVLAGHLRGVLSRLEGPTDHLTLDVVGGVVRVRGEVGSPADAQVVTNALACVPGVVRVDDLTHLPGEVAPNKVEGIDGSRRAWRGRRAG